MPTLTHLQFLVLDSLSRGPATGLAIRNRMEEFGVRKGGPTFYQLMARMEDAGLVEGSYVKRIVKGRRVREREYRICAEGRRASTGSRRFYLDLLGPSGAEAT